MFCFLLIYNPILATFFGHTICVGIYQWVSGIDTDWEKKIDSFLERET